MSDSLEGKNVLLGVSGSIAIHRSLDCISQLRKLGAAVHVALTPSAAKMITPITFANMSGTDVATDLFDNSSGHYFRHLELARTADLAIIVPATANLIGKIRAGIGDEVVTSTILALTCPILIAPAMNTRMYENPIVRENITSLEKFGYIIIEPDEGDLACGEKGIGRLAEVPRIIQTIVDTLNS